MHSAPSFQTLTWLLPDSLAQSELVPEARECIGLWCDRVGGSFVVDDEVAIPDTWLSEHALFTLERL